MGSTHSRPGINTDSELGTIPAPRRFGQLPLVLGVAPEPVAGRRGRVLQELLGGLRGADHLRQPFPILGAQLATL